MVAVAGDVHMAKLTGRPSGATAGVIQGADRGTSDRPMQLRHRTFAAIFGVAFPLIVLIPLLAFTPRSDYSEWETASRARYDSPPPLRDVRVLIASDQRRVRFRAPSDVMLTFGGQDRPATLPARRWHVLNPADAGYIRVGKQVAPSPVVVRSADAITVSLWDGESWSPLGTYPGRLFIEARPDGVLNVINYVDVERYVASVVAREVWPTFQREAYRAQAIAARTYVLLQMKLRQDEDYDVVSTQRAQVYGGLRTDGTGQRAANAAQHTRGLVCTWRDGRGNHLFSTYYSAACGGESQSASIFGPADDVPPLSGGVHCDYCKIAPGEAYRWGPVRIDRTQVFEKLVKGIPEIESLVRIEGIEPMNRSSGSRATRFRIIGQNGQSIEVPAERFRLAIGGTTMRSTDVDIRIEGDEVIFENGRGFGHGLGLCQWGMEGQARAGRSAGGILSFYYPGAELTRVY